MYLTSKVLLSADRLLEITITFNPSFFFFSETNRHHFHERGGVSSFQNRRHPRVERVHDRLRSYRALRKRGGSVTGLLLKYLEGASSTNFRSITTIYKCKMYRSTSQILFIFSQRFDCTNVIVKNHSRSVKLTIFYEAARCFKWQQSS